MQFAPMALGHVLGDRVREGREVLVFRRRGGLAAEFDDRGVPADDREPYDWDALIPDHATPGSRVHFFARAEDGWGNTADSEIVSISVR